MMSYFDESLCYFGAEAILKRLENMLRESKAVRRNKDVEAVHDMRVAGRRARTALGLFAECFPERRVRQWNKRLRRVTRALGEARDTDVQIEFVGEFFKGTKERDLRAGIRRLLLRLRQRREALQAEVVAALDQFEMHGDVGDMQAALLQAKAHGHLHQLDPKGEPVHRHAQEAISQRLEEMLAFEAYVPRSECVEQLHSMRIAAKHLRYAMEIFEPLYDDALNDAIGAAKEVQRQLGEIHDCDVWATYLPKFVEEERQRTVEYFGREGPANRLAAGIEHLRQDRQARREVCYRAFVEFWQGLQGQSVWGQLLAVLERQGDHGPGTPSDVQDADSQEPAT